MAYPRIRTIRTIVHLRIQPLPLWYARLRMQNAVRTVARWRDEVDRARIEHDTERRGAYGVMGHPGMRWSGIIQGTQHGEGE